MLAVAELHRQLARRVASSSRRAPCACPTRDCSAWIGVGVRSASPSTVTRAPGGRDKMSSVGAGAVCATTTGAATSISGGGADGFSTMIGGGAAGTFTITGSCAAHGRSANSVTIATVSPPRQRRHIVRSGECAQAAAPPRCATPTSAADRCASPATIRSFVGGSSARCMSDGIVGTFDSRRASVGVSSLAGPEAPAAASASAPRRHLHLGAAASAAAAAFPPVARSSSARPLPASAAARARTYSPSWRERRRARRRSSSTSRGRVCIADADA